MEKLSKKFVALVIVSMMIFATGVAGAFDAVHADAASAVSISVAKVPDKTEYIVGEALDTSGILIVATYSDGNSTGVNSGYTCSPTVLTEEGRQEITVTYGGQTCSFYVDVLPSQAEEPTTVTTTKANERPTEIITTRPAATTTTTTTLPIYTTPAPVSTTVKNNEVTTTKASSVTDGNKYYGISIYASEYELKYEQSTQLKADVYSEYSGNVNILWTSSDSSVATVNNNGYVVAKGEGSAVITAILIDSEGTAVTDEFGNIVSDTVVINCTMTVWQKIIKFFTDIFSFIFPF